MKTRTISKMLSIFLVISFVGVSTTIAGDTLAKKQKLQIAVEAGDARTFNPHMAGSNQDRMVADMIFNGLLRYPPGNHVDLEPDLASSWEVSKDKKNWTFHIRKGVFFHPFPGYPTGYELTAEDVVFSLKHASDSTSSAYAGGYKGISIEVIDPYTVKIVTEKPMSENLLLPKFSAYSGGFIVSKKAIEENGEDWAKVNPVGTGPFVFKTYEPQTKTVLSRNDKYFRGVPILEEVVVRYMPSVSSREMGLRTGELDMIEGLMEEKWIEKIKSFPGVVADPFGPTEANMLHVNMTKPPFDKLSVRKALSYGINRADIASFMGAGIAVPIYSSALAPPAIGALTKEEAKANNVLFEANAEMAKKLLSEAGLPNGFKAEVIISEMASSYRKPMIAMQAQLKKVGINLDLKVVDHSSFHSLIRKDASPLVLYSPWRPNVDVWLTRFFHSNSTVVTGKKPDTNFSHYGTVDADGDGEIDTIDKKIEAARWELDPNKQVELWKQCQIEVLKNVAVVPIMRLKYVFPMKSYIDLGHPNKWMFTTQGTQITEKTKILAH